MNQELQQKLLEYLNNGEAFIREQAPDFVRQAMNYYAYQVHFEFYATLVVFVGMVGIGTLLFWFSWRQQSDGAFLMGLILICLSTLPFVGIFNSFNDMKKLELAPKLFMIEHLTNGQCK